MAYIVKYNDEYLFDPYTNDDAIYNVKLSAEINAAAYFDFSIPCTHRLYDKIAEREGIVRVYSDQKLLFIGEIVEISDDFEKNKSVSCVDPRDHLDDVMLRPYSTVEGEEPLLAPSSIDGYFQWLIDQYNEGMINAKFVFQAGVNQGAALTKSNYIYKKNEGLPGVGSEIENEILDAYGGYLTMTYPNGIPTLNLYSDVHEANTQIIDFGVNLINFTRTRSTTDQFTAVRPVGGTPERTNDDPPNYQPKPVTIEDLEDGATSIDSDYIKKGDVVYSISKVSRYGYREYNWSESDTTDAEELLEEAIANLKRQVEPKITIDVKAVDLALFMDGYDHLECGEVARIRSKPHAVDEYLLVSSMDIDLQDPSQTTYTLGQAYNGLTGEQSAYVKSLNAGINSSLDAVAGLDQTVKDQADLIDQATSDASDALDKANEVHDIAQGAQDTANEAKDVADAAKDAADSANQAISQINQDLEETANKAQSAVDKANELAGTIENVQTNISGLEGEIDGITVKVDGAISNASSALKQSSETKADLDGFKTSVSQTYTTKTELDDAIAQEVLDRNAAIQVGIDGISSTVSSNYTELSGKINEAQEDASNALEAAQGASEDLANFSETVTEDLNDLQAQIDGSIQTWFYAGVPTLANPPANEWTDSATRNNHLGDLYYDTVTGYAYRFMLQNDTYSWGRITDSDVTKALQNAAKAQDTADNKRRVFVTTPTPPYDVGDLWVQGSGGDIKRCQTAKTSSQSYAAADWILASKYTDDSKANQVGEDLENYKGVVSTTYATKSSLTQTADQIRSEVSETYLSKNEAGETYATKSSMSSIDQKVDSITSTVSETTEIANEAYTIASEVKQTAEGIEIKLGDAITNSVVQYAVGTSSTTPPTSGWSTTSPVWSAGKYIWQRTVNTASDGTQNISDPVCIQGAKGEKGDTGAQGPKGDDGADGRGIKSTTITYQASSSGTTIPTGTWSSSIPSLNPGQYLWTRTVIAYTDGTSSTSYSVGMKGATGATGSKGDKGDTGAQGPKGDPGADGTNGKDGKGVKSTTVTYQSSTSGTTVPSGTWSTSIPSVAAGSYLWTRTVITYTDSTTSTSYSVGKMGSNGAKGDTGSQGPKGDPGTDGKDGKMLYGTSSTAAATAAKTCSIAGFSLYTGVTVCVKFTNANTAANPTLNVSSTGAKAIYVNGAAMTSAYYWVANAAVTFVYDGTRWVVADSGALSKASAAAKTATNYLKFDSNGLCVGDQTAGTLGKNVLIDADSVDIRNGTTVLSSFGPDYIEIGKNSISSTIGMVHNAFEISANTSDGNTNVVMSSNPSATDKGVGTLELNSSNVGTARTKIKLGNTSVELTADEVSIPGNLKVSGTLLYKPILIWSGTWTSGSISIPSLPTYDFFYMGTNNAAIGYYGLIGHRSIGKNTIEAMNVIYEASNDAWHILNFRADVALSTPTTITCPHDWGAPIKDAWVNKSGWAQWLPVTEIYGII